ncbi:MAG: sugar phosphate isomerase/epimerase [Lachnospiraceae bacterium]|nr:sugar phosphate isomerase/epimerase [Lachnospiraceae bacterium]
MNLSVSNIAWSSEMDEAVYSLLQKLGFTGLEIAPTRIFPEQPYARIKEAKAFACSLYDTYSLSVCSMQSIWYGRKESLFGTMEERLSLLDYTRQAIDFAAAIGCPNLVFGSPRNRQRPQGAPLEPVLDFFRELGAYGVERGVTLSMEPNPPIYHTNFINTTDQACDLAAQIRSILDASHKAGFAVNLDLGTMIENQESLSSFPQWLPFVNHIHISEPNLIPLKESHEKLHRELASLTQDAWETKGWKGYVSVEMGRLDSLEELSKILHRTRALFA